MLDLEHKLPHERRCSIGHGVMCQLRCPGCEYREHDRAQHTYTHTQHTHSTHTTPHYSPSHATPTDPPDCEADRRPVLLHCISTPPTPTDATAPRFLYLRGILCLELGSGPHRPRQLTDEVDALDRGAPAVSSLEGLIVERARHFLLRQQPRNQRSSVGAAHDVGIGESASPIPSAHCSAVAISSAM